MLKRNTAFLLSCILPTIALAAPILTINCYEPVGVNMQYGVSFAELAAASTAGTPEPRPSFKEPTRDGFALNPSFILDSNKKKMIVSWSESAADQALRQKAKALGVPTAPPLPPASEASVLMFLPDHITAVEVNPPNWTNMYSFFPDLGIAYFTTQAFDFGRKNTRVMSTFAKCDYLWSK